MDLTQLDPWAELRRHTAARIALGRVGQSLPTRELLKFGLAHVQARDAVQRPVDFVALGQQLSGHGINTLSVHSRADSRTTYLLRPDLGRQLRESDIHQLQSLSTAPDLVIVIADGLSSSAVEHHALPLLLTLHQYDSTWWSKVPVVLAEQSRVALGDDIGEALGARLALVLIGERPGLSSPDSLGAYLTYQPQRGCLDSARNCVSNIRPEGLDYPQAAHKLWYLIQGALSLKQTGIALKDESDLHPLLTSLPKSS